MSKKSSFFGDTYIRTKNDTIVIRAGLKVFVGWLVFAILCACYVYYFFIRKEEPVAGSNNTVELDIPENAPYRKCEIEEINVLVKKYLDAKAACDADTLKSLVTEPSEFDDMTVLQNSAVYLKGFEDTTCYLADGYQEGEYIVIELSYMNIVDVKSKPLDIVSFYIVTDSDGSYKIMNGTLSDEREAFLNAFRESNDVQNIYVHVRGNIAYLLDTDETFQAFYDLINQPSTTENQTSSES